jgi:hypothetical protein
MVTVAVDGVGSPSIDGAVAGGAGVAVEDVGGESTVAGVEVAAREDVAPTSRRAETATPTPTNNRATSKTATTALVMLLCVLRLQARRRCRRRWR